MITGKGLSVVSTVVAFFVVAQEFHLSITSLGSDRYLIRTEDTAAGVPVAETQVEWPVDDWLQQAKPRMDDPIIGLLKGEANLNKGAPGFHKLGETLYNALFHEGAIRESWLRAQGIAQNREEMLRLRLGLKDSRLQRLPWEVLHHDGHPLTTRYDLTFTRYAANFLVGQTLEVGDFLSTDTRLRVLMVIASPDDQDSLKLIKEVEHIQKVLQTENAASPPVDITLLKQPDRSTLAQALEQGNYQVLHYAGHSDFGDSGGDLSLVNQQTGLTERLSGDDLAGLLVNNRVVLTVFNSCRSAHTAGDDAEMDWRQQNLMQALVNRGVPSVIAMAERIPDEVAIAFTQLFYKNLRKGYPIDLSLSRTRQGLIAAFGSDQHYWALPILYLQPDFDGYLMGDAPATESDRDAEVSELPEAAANVLPQASPQRATSDNGTVDLLKQLENTPPPEDDDNAVANFVKQLSETSTLAEEPLMPAPHKEDLVDNNSERTGMAIYDTLPEVPLKEPQPDELAQPSEPPAQPSQNGKRPHSRQQPQLQPRQLPKSQPQNIAEKSPLIWFALGLVALFTVFGLAALALWWSNRLADPSSTTDSESSVASVESVGSPDVDVLIREAQQAIEQGRFADARNDFEKALVQEAIGKTDQGAATNAILPIVLDAQQSDLAYIEGRLIWQRLAQTGEDAPSLEQELQQREWVTQARDVWENLDNDFMKGRIAQGFAYYAAGDWSDAVDSWEAAERIYEDQRIRQNPDNSPPADPLILHVYAGLAMAHWELANLNLEALEAEDLETLSETERTTLQNEADSELAIARDYFSQLQNLDTSDRMSRQPLETINDSPETWDNWFWTDNLLNDWSRIRREFGSEEG